MMDKGINRNQNNDSFLKNQNIENQTVISAGDNFS